VHASVGDSLQGAVGGVISVGDLLASREGEGSRTTGFVCGGREKLWCALNRKYCLLVVFSLFTGSTVAYHVRYCSTGTRVSDRMLERPGKKDIHPQHLYTRGIQVRRMASNHQ
jgi:hypothetical protein